MTVAIMSKATKALASAKLLLNADDTDGAVNRAYYAMLDAATAALVWVGANTPDSPPKTHGGLIGRFGMHLVQTGQVSAELGRSLNRVQELRLTGDYLPIPVPMDKATTAVEEAEAFVTAIRQLLLPPAS